MILSATAHSKVNLFLGVGDVRDDGYHELHTVFQSLSLQDELIAETLDGEVAHSGSPVASLAVQGLGAMQVPTDPSNLVWRAIDLVADEARRRHDNPIPLVALSLSKGIPTAGGMAGGSADAAAALKIANRLFNAGLSQDELLAMAAQLGSDVPFTLLGGTMVGTGRGEELLPAMSRGQYHWALAFNSAGLSTPKVFRTLDDMRLSDPNLPRAGDPAMLLSALASGDPRQVAQHLANDLQAPAITLLPQLRATLRAGEAAGALRGIVSGSGPTCAFLCSDAQHAADVAEELYDAGVASSVAVASGPAAGAELS